MQLLRKFSNGQDVLLANIGILLIIGATSMIEVQILVMVVAPEWRGLHKEE